MSLLLLINFVSIMVTSSNTFEQLILRECPFQDLTNITIYVPHVSDCKKFYKCYNAERILFKCPKNTYFNPYQCVCDQNYRLNCNLLSRIIPRRISNKLQAKSTNVSESITGTISTPIILNSSTLNTKIPQITNNNLTTNPTIKSTYNAEPTTSIITTKNEDKQSSVQSQNNCTKDISSVANTTLSNDSTEEFNTLCSESILHISSYSTLYPETTTIKIIEISTSKDTSILTPSLPLSNSTSNTKYMPTVAKSTSTASDSSSTSYAKADLSTGLSPVITKALSETTTVIKLDQSNSPTETPASNSVTNITILPTKESITSVISDTTLQFTYKTGKQLKPTMASEDFDYILKLSGNSNKNKNSKINKRL